MLIPHEHISLASLNNEFIRDMELVESTDTPILELFYEPTSVIEKQIIDTIGTRYSCDASFLVTTSDIVSKWNRPVYPMTCSDTYQSFCKSNIEENYQYLCIPNELRIMAEEYGKSMPVLMKSLASLDGLNTKPWFMQGWSLYNVGSPFVALATPIFFLILPFLFLKIAGVPITVNSYWTYLKRLFKGHSLGKLFEFSSSSGSSRIYIVISLVFYIVNVVQNIIQCVRFIKNQHIIIRQIQSVLREVREMRERISDFIGVIKDANYIHPAYEQYIESLEQLSSGLSSYSCELEPVEKQIHNKSYMPPSTIGHILACFYRIHRDQDFQLLMRDCYEVVAYQNILTRVNGWFNNMCVVEWDVNDTKIDGMLPITVLDSEGNDTVSNDIDLSKNWIITGKNASGKTTILRSVLWNQLLAQQWGVCFASSAKCGIYDEFHCYLNIPDSFSRDSLFQAEARRCLEVLDHIRETPDKKHLCIFDELYSGTNPVEAISGSVAYIRSLEKAVNTRFLLTTHFHMILQYVKQKNTEKAYMLTEKAQFTYKLQKGVNQDFGAIEVFEKLGYPPEFIDRANNVLKKVNKRFR